MFNFSNVILVCGTTVYVMQDDLTSFIIMITLGTISKAIGASMNIAEKDSKPYVKNEKKILQEFVN